MKAILTADQPKPVKLRYAGREIEIQAPGAKPVQVGPYLQPLR